MEYEYFIELPIVRHTHCNAQRLRDEGIKFVSRLPQTIICRIRVRLTRLLLLSKTRFSTMNSSQSREIDKKLLLIISSEFVTFFVGYRYLFFFCLNQEDVSLSSQGATLLQLWHHFLKKRAQVSERHLDDESEITIWRTLLIQWTATQDLLLRFQVLISSRSKNTHSTSGWRSKQERKREREIERELFFSS